MGPVVQSSEIWGSGIAQRWQEGIIEQAAAAGNQKWGSEGGSPLGGSLHAEYAYLSDAWCKVVKHDACHAILPPPHPHTLQPSSPSHPSFPELCDPTQPGFAATPQLLVPDNSTVLPASPELWAFNQSTMWRRMVEGADSPLCEVLGRCADGAARQRWFFFLGGGEAGRCTWCCCAQGGMTAVSQLNQIPHGSTNYLVAQPTASCHSHREQREWLVATLEASTAPLVLVASGSVVAGGLGITEGTPPRTCSGDDWLCYSRAQVTPCRAVESV